MKTLKASLLASAIATGAWVLGLTDNLTDKMWPAHPQWAVLFLTIGATIVLMLFWPEPQK